MEENEFPATWLKSGFFSLGFGVMSIVFVLAMRFFIIPRFVDTIVDWDDPRGADDALLFITTPFWFLLGVLAGMISVNVSTWMSRSKTGLLPYLAAFSYALILCEVGLFVIGILSGN